MLGSISLLGERARGRRWSVTVSALAIGAIGASASLGFALGLLGSQIPVSASVRAWLMSMLIALAVIADLAWLPRRVGPARQVNDQWLQAYRGWVAGAGFGVQLGLAVVTVVRSATTYLVLAAMVLVDDVDKAVAIGVVYGGVRSASVLLGSAIRLPEHLARADKLLMATDQPARFGVVGMVASWLVVATALWEGG